MKRELILRHEFVEYIPDDLKHGTIYVSIPFATVAHKCCCGCGNEVVTPLSPTDWKLTFDGKFISLDPSIGNWSFPCQSHYWIKCNRVRWARQWSQREIEAGRAHDRWAKKKYYDNTQTPPVYQRKASTEASGEEKSEENLWRKLKKRWST
jgi:Family of unknown function (DUF6527)